MRRAALTGKWCPLKGKTNLFYDRGGGPLSTGENLIWGKT